MPNDKPTTFYVPRDKYRKLPFASLLIQSGWLLVVRGIGTDNTVWRKDNKTLFLWTRSTEYVVCARRQPIGNEQLPKE